MRTLIKPPHARIIMAAAALVGMFASAYLLDVYVRNAPIVCGLNGSGGCEAVRASEWAYVFGAIPRPALGLAFFLPFFVLLCIRAATPKHADRLRQLTKTLAAIGALESVYLVGLQAFAIKAYCLWCLTVSAASFVIAGMAIYDHKEDPRSMSAFRELRWYLLMFIAYAPLAAFLFLVLTRLK
ncbi:MAG: vitamin K epoxide reductase family protein [Candidatus Uhrbacteria bacterium]|nr:vitamin K epoxide reductase family protein [Candidatus Uhrbacteria bacterium]